MKMRLSLAAMVVCACGFAPVVLGEAPLADRVPGGSLAYVGWAGRTLAFNGSLVGQLIQEPVVGRVLLALKSAANEATDDPTDREAIEHAWALAGTAWQHPMALAVVHVGLVEGEPDVQAALLVKLGKSKEAFAKHVDALIELLRRKLQDEQEGLEITKATAGSAEYLVLNLPDVPLPINVGYMGDVFFLAVGEETPRRLAALTAEESLLADKGFAAAHKAVNGKNEQLVFYADVKRLVAAAESCEPASRPAEEGAKTGPSRMRSAMDALGLNNVGALAGAVSIVDRGLLTTVRLFTPAPHRGVLMPLAGKPLTDAELAHLPADTQLAVAINLSAAELLAEVRRVAKSSSPQADEQVGNLLAEIEEDLGLSIPDDLLACLGNTWTLAGAPSWGGFLTGTLLTVEVTDEAKFQAAAQKIEAFITEKIGRPGSASMPAVQLGPHILTTKTTGGVTIKYVAMPGRVAIPVAPAWAQHKGRLYVALWPQVIEAALAGQVQPLTGAPAFVALRGRVGKGAAGLTYVNTPAVLRHVYNLVLVGWTALANAAPRQAGIGTAPDWLPALSTLEKYLQPEMSTISSDAAGIIFRHYGSLPTAGLGALPLVLPAAIPVALRSLEEASSAAGEEGSVAKPQAAPLRE